MKTALALTSVAALAVGVQSDAQSITIDGSSTVYPITEAVAEEFRTEAPDVRVTVGYSGTGGGFRRFIAGETEISNASRAIKVNEYQSAQEAGIEFIEVPVAYDGLSITVHPSNQFVDSLTIEQLEQIFSDDDPAQTWADINDEWPETPIAVYSPGTDSGTYDYFSEVVLGDDGSMRSDITVSEDDNVLVNGVAGDVGAIGYFGSAYYFENQDRLRSVPIINPDTGEGVRPTPETIESGEYAPFSRPLFIYVRADALQQPHVQQFVSFYLDNAAEMAAEVGYVGLPADIYRAAERKIDNRETGTVYVENGEAVSGSLRDLYMEASTGRGLPGLPE